MAYEAIRCIVSSVFKCHVNNETRQDRHLTAVPLAVEPKVQLKDVVVRKLASEKERKKRQEKDEMNGEYVWR